MKRWILAWSLAAFVLVACGAPPQPPVQVATDPPLPTLTLASGSEGIPLGRSFVVTVAVEGAEPNAEVPITFTGVAGIEPGVDALTLVSDTLGRAEGLLTAVVTTPTHVSLVATTWLRGHAVSGHLDVVFDAPGSRATAMSAGASGNVGQVVDVETYFQSLPQTSDLNYVHWYETGDAGLAAESTNSGVADLPLTLLVDNIQYMTLSGEWTEPVSAIEYYLPDTGGGVPSQQDVAGLSLDAAPDGPAANCGSAPTYVKFRQTIDSVNRWMPQRTYVRAVDYNGILPDYILAEGWIDNSTGRFSFDLPICDTSTIFDTSKPDVYFIFETRTDNGLTASHGTLARRHWWRTGTYYEQTAAMMQNMTITVVGANAEAKNTQRIWHKVNQVRNWEHTATGFHFRSDILYPVYNYGGIANASRAAVGQMQIVWDDALRDDILFHEYGHLVYYRRMLGEASYNVEHACNISANCTSFPPCDGCIGHNYELYIGPIAAMIEGWADFFEAVTTRNVDGAEPGWDAEPKSHPVWTYTNGLGNEARVGAYLWDIWDNGTSPGRNLEPTLVDPVSPEGTPQERYARIINHFRNMSLTSTLKSVWISRIKPSLVEGELDDHCTVLSYNTLNSIDSVCDLP